MEGERGMEIMMEDERMNENNDKGPKYGVKNDGELKGKEGIARMMKNERELKEQLEMKEE
ncbi:hypothetical protein RhiirA1_470591 [Rhizophagus irregularis]|uniref:Uncharacterized protein n=1 Tax=Rhizophagus irregularis TaxID=588596 RepID=A0A2N0R5W6_9GLOM|nr:hypothetical protein RhiirA1_470591 [Rhizophagus irregularis]